MKKARKLMHRDSSSILSFSGFGAKKEEEKNRRKSETALPVSQPAQQEVSLPKYYIKGINREGAEEILNRQPIGTFLIRDRESAGSSGCYTLSLKHNVGLKHHKIETHSASNKLIIAGYERLQFDTLEMLTEFFVKSQKKDLALVPYDPDGVCTRMSDMSIEQPSYEVMDAPGDCDSGDMYLRMDEGQLDLEKHGQAPYRKGSGVTPPIPIRKEFVRQPYENLDRPQRGPPQRNTPQRYNGYENLPEKGPLPSPNRSSAPPIPPRIPPSSCQEYENMAGKSHSLQQPGNYENTPPRLSPKLSRNCYQNVPDRQSKSPTSLQRNNYENLPDRTSEGPPIPERRPVRGPGYENYTKSPTGYENCFSKGSRKSSNPQLGTSHSYQNLPPKVAPRRATTQVNYSAEQSLPPRQPVPLRRVKTDTERDFIARRM